MINKTTLKRIIADTESHRIERTISTDNADKFCQAICAFSNVNRFSRGVYRVQKELIENGNGEASFDFTLITAFRVVEEISKKYIEMGFGQEDRPEDHPENRPEDHPENRPEDHPENHPEDHPEDHPETRPENDVFFETYAENAKKLPEDHPEDRPEDHPEKRPGKRVKKRPENTSELLKAIKSNPEITRKGLAVLFNRSPDSIKYNLSLLVRKGIIKREGSDRTGRWIILDYGEYNV